jgi:hypothetical protein
VLTFGTADGLRPPRIAPALAVALKGGADHKDARCGPASPRSPPHVLRSWDRRAAHYAMTPPRFKRTHTIKDPLMVFAVAFGRRA